MKLPYFLDLSPINTWPGEYRVNGNVDLFSVVFRKESTQVCLFVSIFNVGFSVSIVSRRKYDARMAAQTQRILEMVSKYRERNKEK